jgi:hypothetical protein
MLKYLTVHLRFAGVYNSLGFLNIPLSITSLFNIQHSIFNIPPDFCPKQWEFQADSATFAAEKREKNQEPRTKNQEPRTLRLVFGI